MDRPPQEDDEQKRRNNLVVGAVFAVIVVVGILLMSAIEKNLKHERCLEERRFDCDPITVPGQP
jgi:hypothetical protein